MAKNKLMEYKNEKSDDGNIVRHFESLMDEGDYFLHVRKIIKAIDCYSMALEVQPNEEHCLISRSRCYLLEGVADKALADVEASLANNPKNPRAIFQKAEVLYFKSEFEKALVLYHRGYKARPEMETFRLGIQKCEEAINNSVGNPEIISLNLNCDLSYFFINEDIKITKKQSGNTIKKKVAEEKEKKIERKPCITNDKTVKQLLGKLYADRQYLENILNDEEIMDKKTENSEEIRNLAVKGLNYLDDRSDFWQQAKPMYARKKHHSYKSRRNSSANSKQQSDIIKYVVDSLEDIEIKQSKFEYKKAIKQSQNLLKQLEKWTENNLPNKLDIQANVYCLIGNSYLEMGEYDNALEYHKKDREMGINYNLEEAISRSIDNLGRVYAKQGLFIKAIEIWKQKIGCCKSSLESTWLYHEMGRCYLESSNYAMAIEYGEKSVEYARLAGDDTWQMNSSILVAQSSVKFKQFSQALENFNKALEYSKILTNINAEEAIKKAITELNNKIIDEKKENRQKQITPRNLNSNINKACEDVISPKQPNLDEHEKVFKENFLLLEEKQIEINKEEKSKTCEGLNLNYSIENGNNNVENIKSPKDERSSPKILSQENI